MPKGGFGNCVPCPLQKYPRKLGRSVFVNSGLQPVHDQWGFLEAIKPLAPEQIDAALNKLVEEWHPLDIAYAEVPDENADTPVRKQDHFAARRRAFKGPGAPA